MSKNDIGKIIISCCTFLLLIFITIFAIKNYSRIFYPGSLIGYSFGISLIIWLYILIKLKPIDMSLFNRFVLNFGLFIALSIICSSVALCLNNTVENKFELRTELIDLEPNYKTAFLFEDTTYKQILVNYNFTIFYQTEHFTFHVPHDRLPQVEDGKIRIQVSRGLFGFLYLVDP